jgi:hypothetical protein
MAGGANCLRNLKAQVVDGKAYNETSDGRLEEARSTAFPSDWERGGGGGGFVSRGIRALFRTRAFHLNVSQAFIKSISSMSLQVKVRDASSEEQAQRRTLVTDQHIILRIGSPSSTTSDNQRV